MNDGDPNNDTGPLFDDMVLRVTVSDQAPEAPVLVDQTVTILENSPENTVLTVVQATDDDTPAADIRYSITSAVAGPNGSIDASNIFKLNPVTGGIRVNDPVALSYEAFLPQMTGQIRLTVVATDNTPAGMGGPLSDDATITVNVVDVLENDPTGPTPQDFNIQENVVGTVGTVQADDADPTQRVVRYEIVSGDPNGLFAISNTGVLTTTTGLDFETQRTHVLRIRFYDNDIPATFGEVDAIVTVLNVNEPPALPPTMFTIPENTPDGTRVNGGPIRPIDPEGNDITFQIVGGNTGGAFALTPSLGGGFNLVVANSRALDFELTPVFNLQVELTDDGNPVASQIVPIRVDLTDVDEFADIASRVDATGEWFVYRSDSTDFNRTRFGAWSTTIGWSDVMSGDFNADNRTDLIGRDPATGYWYVGLTQNNDLVTSQWGAAWLEPENYVDFVVGDFNGDGRDDVAGRETTTGLWRVGISTGSTFSGAFWTDAFDNNFVWSNVAAGDFNGDGLDDVFGIDAVTGQAYLGTSTGTGFTVAPWGNALGDLANFDNFLVADFDGDGDDDLAYRDLRVTAAGNPGAWRYVVDDAAGVGVNETTNAAGSLGSFTNARSWVNVAAGDFDGNGRADIVMQDGATKNWFVVLSRPGDAIPRLYARWSSGLNYGNVEVGDWNGDGLDDIATRRFDADVANAGFTRGWQVGISLPGGAAGGAKGFATMNWGRGQEPLAPAAYVDTHSGQFDVPGRQPFNEDAESPTTLPNLAGGPFSVSETAANGTLVGTVARDSNFGPNTTFSITAGNVGGAFTLGQNVSGDVTILVANDAAIDFETRTSFNLVITADDPLLPALIPATVRINVQDVVERAHADIISRNSATNEWFAYRSNGTSFSRGSVGTWASGVNFAGTMTGDFNGDGLTDVVAQNPNNNRWFVGIMSPTGLMNGSWGDSWTNFGNYTNFLVGDFNGDGRDDVAGFEIATGQWRLGLSTGTTFTDAVWGNPWSTSVTWGAVKAGDFDGDGDTDIVAANTATGQFFITRSTGAGFARQSWGTAIGSLANFADFVVGDFDGDGDDDLGYRNVTTTGNAGAWSLVIDEVNGLNGTIRTNNAGINNERQYRNAVVGDFDGNGKDDIAIQDVASKNWFVLISRNGDSNPRRYANWADSLLHGPAVVGDWNDDGLDDIAARRLDPRFNGAWQVGLAQPGGAGFPKQFRASRWDVNDPVNPANYINDNAAHVDVPGPQPANERGIPGIAPSGGPLSFFADSPVMPAATELGNESTPVGPVAAPTGSSDRVSPLLVDSVLSDDDDLQDLLDSL